MPRVRLLTIATVATLVATAPTAGAAVTAPAVIDTAPASVNDIAVAPDGTGALAYTKLAGAERRIYVSILAADGSWGAPQRVDPDDGDSESDPEVAAGNGGRVIVGYRDNARQFLKYRLKPDAASPFAPEQTLRDGIEAEAIDFDWDLDMNPSGVAYAAWKESNSGTMRTNARAWRLAGTTGTLIPTALQQNPATESTGASANGPDIRVAVDDAGNGAVLFIQGNDRTFLRRLNGTVPSGTFVDVRDPSVLGEAIDGTPHQLDLDLAGTGLAWTTGTGMYPNGGHVVGTPVTGETAGPFAVFDPLPASSNDNAERPDVTLDATGKGLYASEPNQSKGLYAGTLNGATASPPQSLDVLDQEPAGTENPAAAYGESGTGLVAWTRDIPDGTAGPTEVRARIFSGGAFGADEPLLSAPALGQAVTPLETSYADDAAASRLGDSAVLIQQDDGTVKHVVVGRYDAPPSAPVGTTPTNVVGNLRPVLSWTPAAAIWSPLAGYKVLVDDQQIGTAAASATSFTPTSDLTPGAHTWRVVAVDGLGQETSSAARELPVATGSDGPPMTPPAADKTKPTGSVKVKGKKRVGQKLTFTVKADDDTAIKTISLAFGTKQVKTVKGTKPFTVKRTFKKAKTYKLTLTVTDPAGNVLKRTSKLKIKP